MTIVIPSIIKDCGGTMKKEYHTPGLDIEKIIFNATKAAEAFRRYNQEETDRILNAKLTQLHPQWDHVIVVDPDDIVGPQ